MTATKFEPSSHAASFLVHETRADIASGKSVYVSADKWGGMSICFSDGKTTMRQELTAEQARAIGLELIRAANVSDELMRKEAA